MRWRHPRQSTQQSIKEGGRAIGAEQMPPPTHCPVGCHRRVGIKSTDERRRRDGRRPKSILGFCPAEFICLGHLTLSDFPLPLSLRRPPVCPSPVLLSTDRVVSPGGAAGTVASQHKIHFRTALSIEPQSPRYLWPGLVCKLYPVGRFAPQRQNGLASSSCDG